MGSGKHFNKAEIQARMMEKNIRPEIMASYIGKSVSYTRNCINGWYPPDVGDKIASVFAKLLDASVKDIVVKS